MELDWKKFARQAMGMTSLPAEQAEALAELVAGIFHDRQARDDQDAWDKFAAAAISSLPVDDPSHTKELARYAANAADEMMAERARRRAKRALAKGEGN